MDLPPELRIMIASYALHVPGGLGWKWKNYRKGPRVATLGRSNRYERPFELDRVNALARTCRTLYDETRRMVFSVNTIVFDIHIMHSDRIPKRCEQTPDGSNRDLKAFTEALDFFRFFVPSTVRPNLECVQINLHDLLELEECWDEFACISSRLSDLRVAVQIRKWYLHTLGDWELRAMKELEEEGEPYESEQEQMRKRVDQYMDMGRQALALVAKFGHDGQNWRLMPVPFWSMDTKKILTYFTGAELEMVRAWQAHGVWR